MSDQVLLVVLSVVSTGMVGLIVKIVYDWLAKPRKEPETKKKNEQDVLDVCAGEFYYIKEALHKGEDQFNVLGEKIDEYHNDVLIKFGEVKTDVAQKMGEMGERVRAVEVLVKAPS
jgi:hypothetical protein